MKVCPPCEARVPRGATVCEVTVCEAPLVLEHSVRGADLTSDWSSVRGQAVFPPLCVLSGHAGHSPGTSSISKKPCV